MTDSLIDKLQSLETTLRDVRKRYHINYTELKKLKSKPQIDVTHVNQLKLQLAEAKNAQQSLLQERDQLKKNLASASEQNKNLTEQNAKLHKEVEELKRHTAILQEKNRAAAASTKVVLERLTQIDNTTE